MKYKKISPLPLAICSLVTALCSEAQCMNPQEYNKNSAGSTLKRSREDGSDDVTSNKRPRFYNDEELNEISQIFEKKANERKKKKEKLEAQKKELERYLDVTNPQRSQEDVYKAGIHYAFNVGDGPDFEKEKRLETAITQLKLAAYQGNHDKASYCLAIFYAMGWGCSNEPHYLIKLECIQYLEKGTIRSPQSINNYPKAKRLFEAFSKTPASFNKNLVKDRRNHAQQFYNLIESPKNEEQHFEAGVFKAFGWDTKQDMEDAIKHLLCAPEKYIDDAYTILYLLRINEGVTIPKSASQNKLDPQFLKDPRNYLLTRGKIDHMDIVKDYHSLLAIFSEKQKLDSKINHIENRIKRARSIKNKSIVKENELESVLSGNISRNIPQKEDKMDQVVDDRTTKNPQETIEHPFSSPSVSGYRQHGRSTGLPQRHNSGNLAPNSSSQQPTGNQPGKKKRFSNPTEQFPLPK